ncbi:extracellular solute-binding protein [Phytoactinopolyspora halotolerans]|uniref:Extracellular solute-binding protein n=1 Tax=Phytoactinopolyspora halotolerans TaxID=1981512 RepID=A0A6L9SFQ9_9ACTN|nr:extracellular solute-binding protein [Phytoactinopolyspora halotolerans]NEE03292.1 extracellular solute-binding protein [Phytoactinopolyspora halotolerans]
MITASAALAVALAGCGGDDNAGAASARITYWAVSMSSSIEEADLLEPLLDTFTEETGVEVELEVVPWDGLWNRILTAVSSGQGPDVLDVGNTWSASLQATGGFVEFGEDAMEAIGGTDKFIPASLAATGADGLPPATIPLYGQAYGLYYNTQIFAEAGITEPPATWEELVDVGRRLTVDTDGDGDIDQWGLSILGGSAGVGSHLAFILGRQEGGTLFDDSGGPTFDSDEQVAAVRRYIDLMESDRIVSPSDAESTMTEALSKLADGRAAMAFGQATTRQALASLEFDDYGVTRIPGPADPPTGGSDIGSMVAGTNIAVMNSSEHVDEALSLVGFLTDEHAQVTLNEAYGTLPVIEGAYQDEAFDDDGLQTLGTNLRDFAEPFPQVPEVAQMETLVGGAVKELFAQAATGTVTEEDIRAALSEADSQMEAAG